MLFGEKVKFIWWRLDIQHKGTQHDGLICNTRQVTFSIVHLASLSWVSRLLLCFAECLYPECRGADTKLHWKVYLFTHKSDFASRRLVYLETKYFCFPNCTSLISTSATKVGHVNKPQVWLKCDPVYNNDYEFFWSHLKELPSISFCWTNGVWGRIHNTQFSSSLTKE
jgi:hypothetical protein